ELHFSLRQDYRKGLLLARTVQQAPLSRPLAGACFTTPAPPLRGRRWSPRDVSNQTPGRWRPGPRLPPWSLRVVTPQTSAHGPVRLGKAIPPFRLRRGALNAALVPELSLAGYCARRAARRGNRAPRRWVA